MLVTLRIDNVRILLVNVYAPNEDDPEFFNNLFENISLQADIDQIIVGGDFNVTMDNRLDKKGGKSVHSKAVEAINSFCEEYDWVDVWRHAYPDRFQYTWCG